MANSVEGHSVFQFPDGSNLLEERNKSPKQTGENSTFWTFTKEEKHFTQFLLEFTYSVWTMVTKTGAMQRYLIRVIN